MYTFTYLEGEVYPHPRGCMACLPDMSCTCAAYGEVGPIALNITQSELLSCRIPVYVDAGSLPRAVCAHAVLAEVSFGFLAYMIN
jgi:hypothetical protein